MASSVPPVQTVMSGPSGVTSIAGSMPVSSTGQVTTHKSSPAPNVPGNSCFQPSSTIQSAELKYVKEWEGNLYGKRQGQPVFITRLEGYRCTESSETLVADWPSSMEIVRLISQDHMFNINIKGYLVVFRAMSKHGFLEQMQEKKLCAVIQLPSHTLLLSVYDKVARLIGKLIPADMDVSRPKPTTASTTPETATAAAAASTNEAAASTTATTMPGGSLTS